MQFSLILIAHYTLTVQIFTVEPHASYPLGLVTAGGIVLKAHYEHRTLPAVIFPANFVIFFLSCLILFSSGF